MSRSKTCDYILSAAPKALDGLLEYEASEAGLRVPVGTLAGSAPCIMIDQPHTLRDKEGSLQLRVDSSGVELSLQYENALCDIQAAYVDMETLHTTHMFTEPVGSLRLYRDQHEQWAAAVDRNLVNHEGLLHMFVDLVAGYGLQRLIKNKNTLA